MGAYSTYQRDKTDLLSFFLREPCVGRDVDAGSHCSIIIQFPLIKNILRVGHGQPPAGVKVDFLRQIVLRDNVPDLAEDVTLNVNGANGFVFAPKSRVLVKMEEAVWRQMTSVSAYESNV